MWKRDFPPIDGPPPFEPDPVIEVYKKGVDRTLIRSRLQQTVEQRLHDLTAMQRFVARWRGSAWRNEAQATSSDPTVNGR
jgi:hypothetical protein